jgi:DNA end-binding protein Ku
VLKIGELSCPVALFSAASAAERIAFHMLNRKTGHRLRRDYIDGVTERPVGAEDQVRGYETDRGRSLIIEPDEIAAAIPESDKTLAVEAFIACDDVDETYFDRPYYLAPSDRQADESFDLLRDGMRDRKVVAVARALLFRRLRSVLIRPAGKGLIATTLKFAGEIRAADAAFASIPAVKIEGEMLDLAKHIIATKTGTFDPARFDDRYEAALADLVKAKLAGRALKPRKPPPSTKVVDLLDALRQSAKAPGKAGGTGKIGKAAAAPRKKAG